VPHGGVAADPHVVVGQVDGVARPILQTHQRQVRAVLHHDLDVFCERGRTLVLEHDHGSAERLRRDDDMPGRCFLR
jgi:hypothetical protein